MIPTSFRTLLTLIAALAFLSPHQASAQDPATSAAQSTGCFWEAGNTTAGFDADVLDLAVRTEGGVLEVYAAGRFRFADGRRANGVAMWDGRRWQPLEGPDGVGVDVEVRALAIFDSGSGPDLYAAGFYDTAGGRATYSIARWTGTEWVPVGDPPGTNDEYAWVNTLEVLDDGSGPALYAGGFFSTMGGVDVNGVARWDGTNWSAVGSGVSLTKALALRDAGTSVRLVAGRDEVVMEYDGQDWVPLGGSLHFANHSVNALAIWDDGTGLALYAAGRNFNAFPGAFVYRWNGTAWEALPELGAAIDFGEVFALETAEIAGESLLVAAGSFRSVEDEVFGYLAAWDGGSWRPLETPGGRGVNKTTYALQAVEDGGDSYLLAGGAFTIAGGRPAGRVAQWDGASWSAVETPIVPGNGFNDEVYQYITWDDGSGEALYAAGTFEVVGGRRVNNVARWNGRSWEPLAGPAGIGTDGWIGALAVYDDGAGEALYVGGFFSMAGGVAANNVARWSGTSWSPLVSGGGNGVDDAVRTLAVWDDGDGPALYAGGYFERAGAVESRRVAKWDGIQWSSLDEPNGPRYGLVMDIEPFDDGTGEALYIAGWFGRSSQDGGPFLDASAKWDGASWSTLYRGPALPSWVESLEVWDDGEGPDLYAAGDGRQLSRLNGDTWEVASETNFPYFRSIKAWDDGSGSKLYAGGSGLHWLPGIGDDDHLARWDGSEWTPFTGTAGQEPDGSVGTLFPWNHDGVSTLLVGGEFNAVAEIGAAFSARYTCGSGSRCASDPDRSLCLNQLDRFVVSVTWRDFEGNEGNGQVVPFQTADSGLFYFFDADNWELLVKVLDGCGFNDHFWVFSAATTNVEYKITVTDTLTGTTKLYENPLGVAAPSVTDTTAFATCEAGSGESSATTSSSTAKVTSPAGQGLAKTSERVVPSGKASCVASGTTMCLDDGRFALEIDRRDFEGNTGPGRVVTDTPSNDSGLFQFFGEENWEVLVKVLDACGFNDRYWMFSAATTNVEYTLRVTDTTTGDTVSYFNPLGNAASAVTDTDAFGTCQ